MDSHLRAREVGLALELQPGLGDVNGEGHGLGGLRNGEMEKERRREKDRESERLAGA